MNFIVNESKEKLRGGYYTPEPIARYLSRWVLSSPSKSVLEPSCGDGEFLSALSKENLAESVHVTAVEMLEEEAAKARLRARSCQTIRTKIICDDFLGWSLRALAKGSTFDAVLGNPPFIRYQYLPTEYQQRSESIFRFFHLPFTKHTNAWVPFVVAAMGLLRPGGRLGMVLPAEIIHVMHAQALRTYLGHTCKRILIIDPEELWFKGTLQGAVLLLAEKKLTPQEQSLGLAIQRTSGNEFFRENPISRFASASYINGKTVEGKWTRALLPHGVRSLVDGLAENREVKVFGEIAKVDVGLVTGANKFFLVPDSIVKKYGLHKWAHPMFGRSGHCPGVIYDEAQHEQNARLGLPTNFLWFKSPLAASLSSDFRAYIKSGEAQEFHKRYKCRIRNPWFEVPSVYATKIGMLKRSHDAPRLIHNVLGAFTTDTAYRIQTSACDAIKLVFCFFNSLTALSAELEGRHYGGGVLELVPSEIERLLVPLPSGLRPAIRRLDGSIRSQSADQVLVSQDRQVLLAIGLGRSDQDRLHQAWQALRDRRQRISADDGTHLDNFESENGGSTSAPIDSDRRVQQIDSSYKVA